MPGYLASQWLLLTQSSPPPVPTVNPFEVDLLNYLDGKNLTVYPGHVPQTVALPAITFALVSGSSYQRIAGAAGLASRVYQFSAISTAYLDTITLETSLRIALNGFTGFMGSSRVSSCRLLPGVLDLPYQDNVDASDDGTFMRVAEYRIFFTESIPTF